MSNKNKDYFSIVAEAVAEAVAEVFDIVAEFELWGWGILVTLATVVLSFVIAAAFDKEFGELFRLFFGVECIILMFLFCLNFCALPVTIPRGRAMRSLLKAIDEGNHDEVVRQIELLGNYRLVHSPWELFIRWDKGYRTALEWFLKKNYEKLGALVRHKLLSDEEFARLIPHSIFELRLKQVMSDWEGVLRYLDRQIHAYGKNYNPPPALVADLLIKFPEQCSLDWLDEKGREDLIRFVLEKTRTDVYPMLVLQKGFCPLPSILEAEDKAFEGFLNIVRTVDAETGSALVTKFVKEMSTGRECSPATSMLADLVALFPEQCSLDWLDEKGREDLICFALKNVRADVYSMLVLQKGFSPLPSVLESEDTDFEEFLTIVRTVDAETGAALVAKFMKEMATGREYSPEASILADLVALFPEQCSLDWLDEKGRADLICFVLENERTDVYPTLVFQQGLPLLPPTTLSEKGISKRIMTEVKANSLFRHFLAIARMVDPECNIALGNAFVKEMATLRDYSFYPELVLTWINTYPGHAMSAWFTVEERERAIRMALENRQTYSYYSLVVQGGFRFFPSDVIPKEEWFEAVVEMVTHLRGDQVMTLVQAMTRDEAKQILGYAIQKDAKTLYLLLCKVHGLNLLSSSKSGYTPMMMAAYLGDIELFDMLVALPDGPQMVWERTYDGKTLVDFASEARNGAFLNHFRTFQRKQELRQLEGVSAQEAELLETERKAGELANSLMAEEIDRNDDECK